MNRLGLALFVYVAVDGGMIAGPLPVVGVPMPLLSFGNNNGSRDTYDKPRGMGSATLSECGVQSNTVQPFGN